MGDSQQQFTPLKFDPEQGDELKDNLVTGYEWRAKHPTDVWFFNPWTGIRRDATDVARDPKGHSIPPVWDN